LCQPRDSKSKSKSKSKRPPGLPLLVVPSTPWLSTEFFSKGSELIEGVGDAFSLPAPVCKYPILCVLSSLTFTVRTHCTVILRRRPICSITVRPRTDSDHRLPSLPFFLVRSALTLFLLCRARVLYDSTVSPNLIYTAYRNLIDLVLQRQSAIIKENLASSIKILGGNSHSIKSSRY
jgi:hypothetical protein